MTTTAPSAAPAPGAPQPIARLLIANRGEIAVRIAATCRRLGVRSIAVYTEVDAGSAHVAAADEAVSLGPDPRAYLDVRAIVDAASASGADAVHPGYGFLSENAELARACSSAGLVFVGPSAEVIDVMGSKINAKAVAVRAGVPIVPGRAESGLSDADLLAAVEEIGVPVLLKASAGGGGKGMRVVGDLAEVPAAIASARREAAAAFGDDALMVERFVAAPRHIEVQILGDRHGAAAAIQHQGEAAGRLCVGWWRGVGVPAGRHHPVAIQRLLEQTLHLGAGRIRRTSHQVHVVDTDTVRWPAIGQASLDQRTVTMVCSRHIHRVGTVEQQGNGARQNPRRA